MKAGAITRQNDVVAEYGVRQLALQHAVATHGATADEGYVVKAAEAYLAFLTGSEPEPEPEVAPEVTPEAAPEQG